MNIFFGHNETDLHEVLAQMKPLAEARRAEADRRRGADPRAADLTPFYLALRGARREEILDAEQAIRDKADTPRREAARAAELDRLVDMARRNPGIAGALDVPADLRREFDERTNPAYAAAVRRQRLAVAERSIIVDRVEASPSPPSRAPTAYNFAGDPARYHSPRNSTRPKAKYRPPALNADMQRLTREYLLEEYGPALGAKIAAASGL